MRANEFVIEAWSKKYKSSINCSHPKGFSQRAHCAGKKKHNESVEMEMVCEDCGMCQTHGNLNEIKKGQKDSNGYTKCWPGKHAEGTKKGRNGGQVRNCVPNESVAENRGSKTDQDTIDLVKILWNDGKTPTAIAADLGLPINVVKVVLTKYYSSRPGKRLKLASALTDDDKNTIVSRFLNQDTPLSIGRDYGLHITTISNILKNKLGIDKYNDVLAPRKISAGGHIANKITPEILNKIKELYVAGNTLRDISAHFDNLIAHNNVHTAMKRQPDYAELRAKRDENTRKVKHSPVATTAIHRPGVIDPQGVHGPSSRHRSGVDWQKLN